MKYFFDTYALFEIMNDKPGYRKFAGEDMVTSILNLGELYYGLMRDGGAKFAQERYAKIKCMIIPVTEDSVKRAMEFRFANSHKLSYIDCIGYQLAKENNLLFLTGDKAFEGIENVEFVK